MFSDKLSSSTSPFARGPAQLLTGSRSHLQHPGVDSQLRENAGSPAPPIAPSTSGGGSSKVHTSPSKMRTYDSKMVSREMHRLGSLAYLPHYAPSLNAGTSSTALATTSSITPPNLIPGSAGDNPWGTLHVLVLPLFNGEPLRIPIEDLNQLVKRHIQSVVSNSPARAVGTLESETSELVGSGMDTLNGKLAGVEEDKLVGRVVELWGFFWDQVLPYVEGVLLPLQTDSVLSSLYRTPKTHRNSSPTRQNGKGPSSMPSYTLSTSSHIDVRTLALRSFRDRIIFPIAPLLNARLNILKQEGLSSESHTYPRLQQMLLVLVSQGRQPTAAPLTTPAPTLLPGELAVQHLLNVVRSGASGARLSGPRGACAPRTLSFLSGNVPRDRRGRIAHRPGPLSLDETGSDLEDDVVTPRLGLGPNGGVDTRERERELLESLRSPDPPETRQSVGGWGLGTWDEGSSAQERDDDDEDEQMELEEAEVTSKVDGEAE
ncbi:HbrB-domain-containing protein [Russula earlei]|uniref:HbrB-domain-containing protein n=1 Tax=Russula earlei TaxID=71964 RepID=A0ACC0UFM4_9AGAM|nr:HbrB-domain-containing protein [Russula earlei]